MEPPGANDRGATVSADGTLDLKRLFAVLLARRRWILTSTIVAFSAALAFVTLVSPRYTGVAKVLLENQESYFTRPEKAGPEPTTPFDPESVQSEAESIWSVDLARKAVDKLGLVQNDEFNPSSSGNPLTMLLSAFGGASSAASAEDRVVDAFLARLTVFPVAKSKVLQIEFTSSNSSLAARGANTMADLFLDEQEEAKKNEAKAAGAWLASKIEQLRGRVAEADAKVESFRAASGLLAGANGMTVPAQQLAEINAQIAAARAAQSAATAKAQLLREMLRSGRLDSVPDVAKDESLRRYAELRVTLKAQIAEESRTLLPGHPKMKELNGQVAGLEEEIRNAATKVVRGLEDEAQLAGSQVRSLEGAIAKQSQAVATSNVDEVQLRALELDAKTAREQLESYIEKYHEAIARDADNAAPPNARIISTATPPRIPTFPKKGPTLLITTLAGFCLSVGAAVARALLVDPAPNVGDAPLEGSRNREPIGSKASWIARAAGAVRSDVADSTPSPESIVDELAKASAPGVQMTVLVTGEGNHGALAIALTAARTLSKRGRTVLLDLGASQPWLGDVFDRTEEDADALFGLTDVLDGRATFDQALHRDLSARLDILPPGNGEVDAKLLRPVLEALAQSYAFVVVHASDWRLPAARAVIGAASAAIVCAPAARLAAAKERLRRSLPDPAIVTEGVVVGGREPIERAA